MQINIENIIKQKPGGRGGSCGGSCGCGCGGCGGGGVEKTKYDTAGHMRQTIRNLRKYKKEI